MRLRSLAPGRPVSLERSGGEAPGEGKAHTQYTIMRETHLLFLSSNALAPRGGNRLLACSLRFRQALRLQRIESPRALAPPLPNTILLRAFRSRLPPPPSPSNVLLLLIHSIDKQQDNTYF